MSEPLRLALLLLVAVVAVAATAAATRPARARADEVAGVSSPAHAAPDPSRVPPIDRARPARVEVATFAFG